MKRVVYKERFTRVELIVVVLLTLLLIAVIFMVIWSQRDKTRLASALTSLKNVHSIALLCVNDASDLNNPVTSTPGTTTICPDTGTVWPQLPQDWSYTQPVQTAVGTNSFLFTAMNVEQTKKITCNMDGCEVFDIFPDAPLSASQSR